MKGNGNPWNERLSPVDAKARMVAQNVLKVPQENPAPPDPFSGILIAGGRSTRMQKDKASLLFEGVPMWRRQIAVLEQAGAAEVLISGPQDGPWQGGSWRSFPDATPHSGPVSGLLAGLRHSPHALTACLAVDMPGMQPEYMRGLVKEASQSKKSIVPRIDGRWEPLAAAYHRNILPLVLECQAAGQHSLQKLMDSALTHGLVIPKQVEQDGLPLFWNSNTPAEWDAFAARD